MKAPTTLIELTTDQFDRFQKNSIQLFGLQKNTSNDPKSKTVTYVKTVYGDHLKPIKKKTKFGKYSEKMSYEYVDLSKVKNRYMMIICNKHEIILNGFNSKIQNAVLTDSTNPSENSSGYVLLMMTALFKIDTPTEKFKWDRDFLKMISSCKNNVLQTYDHHGTSGKCFSFGNKPDYGNVNGVSVNIYSSKKSNDVSKQRCINFNVEFIENIFSNVVNERIHKFSRIIPEINWLLSPILDLAYQRQQSIDRKILTPLKVSQNGCWNSHIFVNSCTSTFHVEKDCSYTCIHVPNQDFTKKDNICEVPGFVFQFNDSQRLIIQLNRMVSIMYNAQCLMHRQVYYPENGATDNFFNVATYANEKLFNHLRKTFNRLT